MLADDKNARRTGGRIAVMGLLKKFILWEYSRETSVYVIFCLLIVAFIFLTPKSWFEKRERAATQAQPEAVKEQDR